MQFFDECLTQRLPCVGDHIVNAAEMVDGFDDIINIYDLFFKTDRIGLEDISCLIMRELAAFHMIGIIGQFDLDFVIDTAFSVAPHFIPQDFQQCMRFVGTDFVGTTSENGLKMGCFGSFFGNFFKFKDMKNVLDA